MDYIKELTALLDDKRVSTNETIIRQHSEDESYLDPSEPDVVVFPENTQEVSEIVKIANKYNIPVTPFGIGSSLEGNVIPYQGGISVDFSLMNKILKISENDLLVTVQPGVTRTQLNKELSKYGLFFSVDPGADATMGGMTATNASGTTAVRYGVMRDQVRDLEVVLADGSVIHTATKAEKSSSGYNLNSLFVGSEGTLGLFTEITVKVYGIPEHIAVARAVFPTIEDAVNSVVNILQSGVQIAKCELVDQMSIRQINIHSETDYIEAPHLFLEFHGNKAGVKEDIEFTTEIMKENNCQEIIFENDSRKTKQLWEARHNLAYAFIHGYPHKKMMLTDVSVPISKLSDAVMFARNKLDELGLKGALLGHVGDGNFHTILMVDMDDNKEVENAKIYNESVVKYALSIGGTCTGEHGVGIGKKKYQKLEHGHAYDIMAAIKKTLDPKCILNPDKIIDKY